MPRNPLIRTKSLSSCLSPSGLEPQLKSLAKQSGDKEGRRDCRSSMPERWIQEEVEGGSLRSADFDEMPTSELVNGWNGLNVVNELSVLNFSQSFGDAGKISDLITTGTDPDVGISAPMSM